MHLGCAYHSSVTHLSRTRASQGEQHLAHPANSLRCPDHQAHSSRPMNPNNCSRLVNKLKIETNSVTVAST